MDSMSSARKRGRMSRSKLTSLMAGTGCVARWRAKRPLAGFVRGDVAPGVPDTPGSDARAARIAPLGGRLRAVARRWPTARAIGTAARVPQPDGERAQVLDELGWLLHLEVDAQHRDAQRQPAQ